MIKIGTVQKLIIKEIVMKGAILIEKNQSNNDSVLLATPFVPHNAKIGDTIEVFVFADHFGNLISSTKKPLAQAEDIAYLKVEDFNSKGAYLNWGLSIELFSPRDNIFYHIQKGNSYLFRIFVNKEGKIRATTDIYDYLKIGSKYQKDDSVNGVVYKILENESVLVAVDNIYYGLIPKNENFLNLNYGDKISGRVIRVREDGKLDISTRKKAKIQSIDDSEIILKKIKANKDILYMNDKSSPEEIKSEFNISKKAFKRAVGRLLKDGFIKQNEDSIEII